MNANGVSILICTFNGKKNLSPTLEHLAVQTAIGQVEMELLVVDNASTDGTADFVKQKWESLGAPFPLTLLSEPRAGKGNASVLGYSACKNEIIIVCDDDNWLRQDYVRNAYDIMIAHPNVGVLGGKSEPYFEDKEPVWFKHQQQIFATGEQFPTNGIHTHEGFLWGAGMVFRKTAWDILKKVNYSFFLNEQRSGKLNWGGDDTELCEMITVLGYDLYYSNTLNLQHYMPAKRMTKEYLESRYFGSGRSRIYMYAYIHCRNSNDMPGKNLKYPLWLDRYIHKTKERLQTMPKMQGKSKAEADPDVLSYIALKGELFELWRIKNGYSAIYEKIFALKQRIAEYKRKQTETGGTGQ